MTKTVKILFIDGGGLGDRFSFFKELLQKISALLYTGSIRIAEESRMRELPKDEKKVEYLELIYDLRKGRKHV